MSSLLVFNGVYRLEIQSVMLVFSTPLVKKSPSNILTGSPTLPPLLPYVNNYRGMYCIHTVQVDGEVCGVSANEYSCAVCTSRDIEPK
jgi:hypothetical protein